MTNYRLQPLRVPSGWLVLFNELLDVDPNDLDIENHAVLTEDLLQMKQELFNRLLDVGWYPTGKASEGVYHLLVYEGDFHGRLLHQMDTTSRAMLVVEIERVLQAVCDGRM